MDDSKHHVLGRGDRRAEGPSSDWPESSNPRVWPRRRRLIARSDCRLIPLETMYAESSCVRSLVDEQLREVEQDERLCPDRDLEELACNPIYSFLSRWLACFRVHPAPSDAGGVARAIELMLVILLLHSQRPPRGVDLRYPLGVVAGLAWRKATGEFLGATPRFIETEYFDGVLVVTNPQWQQPIRGEHALHNGHAFAAELRKQGIECNGAELDALPEARLRNRLLAMAIQDPCQREGEAA